MSGHEKAGVGTLLAAWGALAGLAAVWLPAAANMYYLPLDREVGLLCFFAGAAGLLLLPNGVAGRVVHPVRVLAGLVVLGTLFLPSHPTSLISGGFDDWDGISKGGVPLGWKKAQEDTRTLGLPFPGFGAALQTIDSGQGPQAVSTVNRDFFSFVDKTVTLGVWARSGDGPSTSRIAITDKDKTSQKDSRSTASGAISPSPT